MAGNPLYSTSRWRRLRERIFAERGRKCEECGKRYDLIVHHIKWRRGDHLRTFFDVSGLKVLCRECHGAAHPEFKARSDRRAFYGELMPGG